MNLPPVNIPQFSITIPSTKKKKKFRPFLVSEEKILLIAMESHTDEDLVTACKQIVAACSIDDISIDDLTTFDLEYIFLKLRAAAVNNISKLSFIDNEDGKQYDFEVDLAALEVTFNPNHSNRIDTGDGMIIEMKYPTMALTDAIAHSTSEVDMVDKLISHCVKCIYQGDNLYDSFSQEELSQWIAQHPPELFEKLRGFFDTLPSLKHTLTYTNEKGSERTIELAGLQDFFLW